jgi:colanic acid biosynthesis glycosyl transferase WcaI
MKILLLSPFFFPEQISTGKYNTHLAETLALAGYDVTVVASHPVYPNWQAEICNAALPRIEIKRGGGWIVYPRSPMLRRMILELWYTWHVSTSYFRLGSRPDIVISIFPPSLFFVFLHLLIPDAVCRIGIVHDLQGVYAARSSSILHNVIHFVEKRCFSACDRLIFLSQSMANRAIAEYRLVSERCGVCYPFVATDVDVKDSTSLVDVLLPDVFNVVYSGALGEKQNPDELFAFMNHIANEHADIACHIFSGGPIFDRLRLDNQGANNCKVQFHTLVSGEQLAELYARSSVQIIPQALNTSEGSLPSKLPNLLATGVPIFVICEPGSELGDLVNEAKAGVVANTWDISELAEQFRVHRNNLVMESKYDRRQRLKAFVKSKFSIDYVVENVLAAAKNK